MTIDSEWNRNPDGTMELTAVRLRGEPVPPGRWLIDPTRHAHVEVLAEEVDTPPPDREYAAEVRGPDESRQIGLFEGGEFDGTA